MPTIRDVAKRAGVAPITVSRVINRDGYVREETRLRVERAIAELDYIPNSLGPSLRSKRTTMLALVLSDIINPFWTTVARGVEDTANRNGYHLILCNTDASPEKQDEYLMFLLKKQTDGFLVAPVRNSSPALEVLHKRNVPLVILDRHVPYGVDVVRGDSEGGAYTLTKYLLDLGHRHIAMVSGPQSVSTATERVQGYRRALVDARLDAAQQVYWGEFTQESGYDLTRQALLFGSRPTAFFAANNFIALGIMRALRDAGLRVPEQVSVVAFDDIPPALTLNPFFTVIAQPAYEMGKKATELLLARLSGQSTEKYQEIVLPTTLIVRDSAARPSAADQ